MDSLTAFNPALVRVVESLENISDASIATKGAPDLIGLGGVDHVKTFLEMLGTIGPNANQIHMHVQGYSSTQLQCFVRFLLKVVRACLGCSKLHYQPTRRGNFPNPNL